VHTLPFGSVFTVMEAWFMPLSWAAPVRHVLGALLIVIVVVATVKCRRSDRPTMRALITLSLFVTIYAATIVATRDFLDISTPIDARILIPVQPVAYVLVLTAVMSLVAAPAAASETHVRAVLAGIGVCLLVALVGVPAAVDSFRRPFPPQAHSPTMALLARLPARTLVATNDPYQIFLATGRGSVVLPSRSNWTSGERNRHFSDDVSSLISLVRSKHGAVLLAPVNVATVRLATESDLTRGGLHVVARSSDGGALLQP
jgi:hypothetical protein